MERSQETTRMPARERTAHDSTEAFDRLAPSRWWLLRGAAGLCFIGHGVFGLLRKEAWLPYFALAGIDRDVAWQLMPFVGSVDILVGLLVIVQPRAVFVAYMVVWALWTATLRPLTGEPVWETIERAGNYGVPLALLLLAGVPRSRNGWLARMSPRELSPDTMALLRRTLSVTAALLLLGHAGLGISGKPLLIEHYTALGFSLDVASQLTPMIGWAEVALALAVLVRPIAIVGLMICVWKLASEGLFIVAGAPVWEFVERAGSYAAPLALVLLPRQAHVTTASRPPHANPRGPLLRRIGVLPVACLAALMAVPAEAQAQAQRPDTSPERKLLVGTELLARLRAGGLALACRHAATDHDARDSGSDRSSQRNLSEEGVRQAREIGDVIRTLGIPIGEIRANPMYRNRETAEYAFGQTAVDSTLAGRDAHKVVRSTLGAPVPLGTNRALVTRMGVLYPAFEGHRLEEINEGDCIVAQPSDDGTFQVVAHLKASDWRQLGQ